LPLTWWDFIFRMKAEFLRILAAGLGDSLSIRGKSVSGGRSSV
jgi:hypothetical protein